MQISYSALGLTLFISITGSGIASKEINRQIELNRLKAAANAAYEQAKIDNQRKSEKNKRQKITKQKSQDRQRQLKQTCEFWVTQYSKTHELKDKIHRENACRDAGIKTN